MRAQGMGANVIITEVDPLPALRAVMDGFRVMTMDEAAKLGDIFCTATGMKDVIVDRHFASMKDGAIISNTGHYDCEINIEELTSQASSTRTIRDNNVEYTMKDGRKIFLLADGRLVNLAAAEGHPSEVMDMSFANQYLALCRLAKEGSEMKPIVYDITTEQDQGLATTKLATLGFEIDSLTNAQIAYLDDYNAGT
jgi:adenosylhomocysteinase